MPILWLESVNRGIKNLMEVYGWCFLPQQNMKNPHLREEEAHIFCHTMNFNLVRVVNAKHMITWL